MIGNRFYTWFKNYYQWVGGAFNETLLLPLVRATAGLRAGAIRYDETTNTVETYDGTNWNAIPSASGFVPYTGATQDVNLGEQGLEAGYLQLDTTPTGTPTDQGTIYWDIDAETAALIMNGTVQKVGEDVFFHVQNKTGSPIPKGTCVRFAGTDGNSGKILIAPFLANGTYPSQYFMGVTSETIADGAFGKVYHFGKIRGVNTQAYNAGDILYASTSVAGGFQTTPPVAPNNIIVVAAVISKANNGTLMIRSTLGSNINNDEGVLISGAANGQGLFYENGLWKNKTIATVLGYTPGTVSSVGIVTGSTGTDINVSNSPVTVSGNITLNIPTASATNRGALSSSDWTTFNNKVSTSRQLTINGTAFDLSADRTWSVGTVTSVAASAPLSVSGSPTTTPVITISQANSTTNGFLSSTDWNTFNNKQNTLSLTTTGNSGASTLVGSTLNVPEYTISGLGGVPTTRQLTINGTAFDLSANRSWSVGTVTSVGLTSSTSGVTITDSPVTVSGTIGIAIATANGSQQGLLSSTDWTTFNNKQNTISLTTTGTSGAATLIGATLNVPQYQAQGNYITSLTGEATASGPGAASVTLSTTAVTGKLLTGLNLSGGGTIAATDSILTAFGKVQNQISAMVGGVMYQGTWNASTNTPTLTSSVGTKGNYYIVDVSGTTNLNGITDWRVGDWAIFNGSTWDKVDNTDAVSSVNGFTGAVSLTTSHIAEGTNLYYLDSRSRTAISLTTTGNSGAATYDNVSGIINVPQYTLAGLGGVPTTRQLTINGTAFDISADRSWSVGTVTSVGLNSTTSGITITNTPVTSSGALTINIATASGSQNGLLSSTDWNSFNTALGELIVSVAFTPTDLQLTKANSQVIGATVPLANGSQVGFLSTTDYNTFNNKIGGSGASGQVAYFNGTSTITGESNLFWDAANDRLGIGTNVPATPLHIQANHISGQSTLRIQSTTAYASGGLSSIGFNNSNGSRMGLIYHDALGLQIETGTALPILFNPNGNLRMTLDASGNLGLGVTPSAWGSRVAMQISPKLALWGDTNQSIISHNIYADPTDKYIASGAASIYSQSNGSHIWFTAPSGTAGNAITFTQAMTLDASGRLGIGTTSPQSRTHVSFQADFDGLRIQNSNRGHNYLLTTAGSSAEFFSIYDIDNSQFLYQVSNDNGHGFLTGGVARMSITSGGEVLIGETSSAYSSQLTISYNPSTNNGPIVLDRRSLFSATVGGSQWFGGRFNSAGNYRPFGGVGAFKENSTDGNSSGYLSLFTNGNAADPTERMRITSGGNVGIGETSPTEGRLVINNPNGSTNNGATGNTLYLKAQTANANLIRFSGAIATDLIVGRFGNADAISIGTTGGTEIARFTSGGNVGIGTTSPNRKLQIDVSPTSSSDDGINVFNGTNRFLFTRTGSPYTYRGVPANAGMIYSETNIALLSDGGDISMHTSGGERMRITSGGNVGIGTANPQDRLEVNGAIAATGASNELSAQGHSTVLQVRSGISYLTAVDYGVEYKPLVIEGKDISIRTGVSSTGDRLTINSTGAATFSSTIQTAAPSGGTARAWKLGDVGTQSLTQSRYVEVEINGTTYWLLATDVQV